MRINATARLTITNFNGSSHQSIAAKTTRYSYSNVPKYEVPLRLQFIGRCGKLGIPEVNLHVLFTCAGKASKKTARYRVYGETILDISVKLMDTDSTSISSLPERSRDEAVRTVIYSTPIDNVVTNKVNTEFLASIISRSLQKYHTRQQRREEFALLNPSRYRVNCWKGKD